MVNFYELIRLVRSSISHKNYAFSCPFRQHLKLLRSCSTRSSVINFYIVIQENFQLFRLNVMTDDDNDDVSIHVFFVSQCDETLL